MKLSIVIICWNDLEVISDCIKSIYAQTDKIDFEIIVTDNSSTDGSVACVRENFPRVRIVENGRNLGFGGGNNEGIRLAQGEYILLLNPDTIIRDRALEKLVAFAEAHPDAGAVGCRALNPDGSLQSTAHPAPTVFRHLLGAMNLRWLGKLSKTLLADQYPDWDGRKVRDTGFQAACCLLVQGPLLKELGGFDVRFFHQFEDADLCHRIWKSGKSLLFCPDAEITHIGGQNRGRYPIRVILETQRSKYRYFHKHYGVGAAQRIRWVSLLHFGLRFIGYRVRSIFSHDQTLRNRLEMYRILIRWHWGLNPAEFIKTGSEPDLGYAPLARPAGLQTSVG